MYSACHIMSSNKSLLFVSPLRPKCERKSNVSVLASPLWGRHFYFARQWGEMVRVLVHFPELRSPLATQLSLTPCDPCSLSLCSQSPSCWNRPELAVWLQNSRRGCVWVRKCWALCQCKALHNWYYPAQKKKKKKREVWRENFEHIHYILPLLETE